MSDLLAGLIVLGILSAWLIAALICKGGADQDKREREALKKAAEAAAPQNDPMGNWITKP